MRDIISGISAKQITLKLLLVRKTYVRLFQKEFNLVVDGIFGKKTRAKAHALHAKRLIIFLSKKHYVEEGSHHSKWYLSSNKKRDSVMSYLAREEGEFVHGNKGESTITSPYGLYYKYNSDAEIFAMFTSIYKFLGMSLSDKASKVNLINNILSYDIDVRLFTVKSVYEHYIARYSNISINNNLTKEEAVSFLSMSILFSLRRATRFLQYSIGVTQDGIFGKNSLEALSIPYRESINNIFLDKSQEYLTAIGDKTHIKGWTSRINRLRT